PTPARPRTTPGAAPAGAPVEAAEAKPRRTRKAAADIPAQSAPETEAAGEAKPRVRRTRKATAAAEPAES
ncbi:hypothetical protein AB8O53_36040, partial [Streptomyces pilosus]